MPSGLTVACSDCGQLQRIPPLVGGEIAICVRCRQFFDRAAELAQSVDLALGAAILVLLVIANATLWSIFGDLTI